MWTQAMLCFSNIPVPTRNNLAIGINIDSHCSHVALLCRACHSQSNKSGEMIHHKLWVEESGRMGAGNKSSPRPGGGGGGGSDLKDKYRLAMMVMWPVA